MHRQVENMRAKVPLPFGRHVVKLLLCLIPRPSYQGKQCRAQLLTLPMKDHFAFWYIPERRLRVNKGSDPKGTKV